MNQRSDHVDRASQVTQALRALEKMQAKLDAMTRARTAPIAVIGVGCRFPGADSPDAFWDLLRNGADAVREVPPDRWDLDALYDKDPDAAGKIYTRWCGLLKDVDQFDPAFFGISPREAISMDPQQRLLLEVAWEALERAAYTPERLASSETGVYVGACSSDYVRQQFADLSKIDAYAGSGSAHSILANRLSYFLDLQGPSMAIDTACSSSLVAIQLACQSLRSGDCQIALAAGVNLILSPEPTIIFCRARMMAADGRCKTFDSRADGYVRGEGCGVVVLKRLSDALTHGDPIWAVIRGAAVNQDGRSNGLAAPNLLAQQRVLRQAVVNAGVDPGQVGYVEAHGTGTALGDPIEVEALAEIYGKPETGNPCLLGSVKTNIGHLEGAAGIAGLIKVVLCLQRLEIPPHLHLRTLNPNISLENTRFAIPTEHSRWPADSGTHLAGVSSFGFGGTNAHVILEAAPARAERDEARAERPFHLLTISARTAAALSQLAGRYEEYLGTSQAAWSDICATSNSGRAHFSHRLAVVAPNADAARQQLAAWKSEQSSQDVVIGQTDTDRPKVGFLFTGQGSQYVGMGRQLYEAEPAFREALDRCAAILDPLLDRPVLDVMFAPATDEALHQTMYTQPALFALEWALAQLWMSWGIQPDYLLGHSLGELVAACLSGVFSLDDGLRLVAARGRLTQRHALPGSMAAIFADPVRVRALIEAEGFQVAVVAENGTAETIIGGVCEQVAAMLAAAMCQGFRARSLSSSLAFHSSLMDPVLAPFAAAATAVQYRPSTIPLISNRTGAVANREDLSNAEYWLRQLREPVLFGPALQTLVDRGVEVLIEIGPQPTLLNIQQREYPGRELIGLPSLRQGGEDWRQLLHSLARYHVAGGRVNWDALNKDCGRRSATLPTYPFQRARYWLDHAPNSRARDSAENASFYRLEWRIQAQPQPSKSASANRWMLVADQQGVAAALATHLVAEGADVTLIDGDFSSLPDAGGKPCVILDLASLDLPSEPPASGPELLDRTSRRGGSALRLIRGVLEESEGPTKIWLITSGAHVVQGLPARPALAQTPLWGLGRVLAHEHPAIWGGLIDVDPAAPAADTAKILAKLVLMSGHEDQWVVRAGQCYAARLVRYTPPQSAALVLDANGTYLIIGGLGEMGLSMANWLVSRGARRLALAGRTAPGPAQQERIDSLLQSGAVVSVFEADMAYPLEVERILEAIAAGPAPLRGVIHCAGVLDDGVILRQDESRLARVLAPKVSGAWELHARTTGCDLQFFILCSSAAGILGSPGQSNYAAANVFLDALARFRRAAGMPALSVQWGPWSLGMSRTRRGISGLETMKPETALSMLEKLLSGSTVDAAAMQVSWSEVLRQSPESAELPILAELIGSTQGESLRTESLPEERRPARVFERLATVALDEHAPLIRTYLEQRINAALHRDGPIVDTQKILELGMDSLMVVEVLNDCRRDLQIALYPREIYALPNFGALAQYLAREFERSHGQGRQADEPQSALAMIVPASRARVRPVTKRNRGIVFLLSSPRSGSTLLRVMLAGHSALLSPPELHLLAFDSMRPWSRTLGPSYLTEGLQRALMELMNADATAAEAAVQTMINEDQPVQQVYATLQDLAGERLLVDKSPTYGGSLETLQRAEMLFEGARYIHLIRHPFAVIESFVRNRMDKIIGIGSEDPYLLAERAWTTTNSNIRQFLQEIEPARKHVVRYEDLVTDPSGISRTLCDFLQIRFEPAMLEPYEGGRMTDGVHSRSLPIGDPGFLAHTGIEPVLAEAWRSVELPHGIGQPARELARFFNYPISSGDSGPDSGPEMQETWLDVRGIRLCLCTWGAEDGPLVLCLHGILEHGASWELVAKPLAARGYRVIAPDLRGHGRSDHVSDSGSYRLLDFLGDVDAIARSLSRPFQLVGHSMGAAIAAMYAIARPEQVSALMLVEPPALATLQNLGMADPLAVELDHLATPQQHPVFKDLTAAAERLCQATPSLPSSLALRAAQRLTEPCDGGVRWRWDARLRTRAGLAFDGAALTPDLYREMLARITAPITVVYGDGSRAGSESAREAGPFARLEARRVVLPGGHHLHFEAPDALAALIAECPVTC